MAPGSGCEVSCRFSLFYSIRQNSPFGLDSLSIRQPCIQAYASGLVGHPPPAGSCYKRYESEIGLIENARPARIEIDSPFNSNKLSLSRKIRLYSCLTIDRAHKEARSDNVIFQSQFIKFARIARP